MESPPSVMGLLIIYGKKSVKIAPMGHFLLTKWQKKNLGQRQKPSAGDRSWLSPSSRHKKKKRYVWIIPRSIGSSTTLGVKSNTSLYFICLTPIH